MRSESADQKKNRHGMAGMNLLSKFCIAVSATQKLNCVAVGVICVAVFWCVLEKK